MKLYNKFLLSGLLTLLLSSCSMLDINPQSLIPEDRFYKRIQDIEYATAGVYNAFATTALYGGDYTHMHTSCSDLVYANTFSTSESPTTYTHTVNNSGVKNLWRQLYICINRANEVIDGIDESTLCWDKEARRYRAEVVFLRAHAYSLLVQFFGAVPMRLTSHVKSSDVDMAATSAQKIMDWVYEQMSGCIAELPEASEYTDAAHVNKSVVCAMLARVSLVMAGVPIGHNDTRKQECYANALRWAKEVNGTSTGRADEGSLHKLKSSYQELFIDLAQDRNDISCREVIWSMEFNGNGVSHNNQGRIGSSMGIWSNSDEKGRGGGQYLGYNTLHDLYLNVDTDPTDLTATDSRYTWNLANYKYNIVDGVLTTEYYDPKKPYSYVIGTWRREYELTKPKAASITSIDYPIIRFSDVLLMIAEAENELYTGDKQNALDCINDVRVRAGLKPAPFNRIYMKKLIENERAREFPGEGHRHMDLLRWGKFVSAMEAAARAIINDARYPSNNAENMARTLFSVKDKHTIYPIPQAELNINKLMKQNIGW